MWNWKELTLRYGIILLGNLWEGKISLKCTLKEIQKTQSTQSIQSPCFSMGRTGNRMWTSPNTLNSSESWLAFWTRWTSFVFTNLSVIPSISPISSWIYIHQITLVEVTGEVDITIIYLLENFCFLRDVRYIYRTSLSVCWEKISGTFFCKKKQILTARIFTEWREKESP